MIAFNFNIHFQDELLLDDGIYDNTKEHIHIIQSKDPNLFETLSICSEYLPLSGREARYCAQKVYGECKGECWWAVDVKDVMILLWQYGTDIIEYIPKDKMTPELLQFWVLHTILPMKLALEATYDILHVGAVEVAGVTIVFSAESFGGKSTMTDYFIKQGHILLSDDTLGVYKKDDTFMAVASYPFHRPYREAESLGYKVTNIATEPKPVKALFLLAKGAPDANIEIIEVKGIQKYRAFHFSTFINFDFMKEQRFKRLSTMAQSIPVYKVTVPWDIKRLPEVYKAITKYVSSM